MKVEKGGNGQPVILSGEMYKLIAEILSDLASKTRARTIIFADINGHPITQRGQSTEIDIPAMAALAAADFSATSEMSKMIGEGQRFKYIYHEGQKTNIYLCNVGDHFLLIIVFDAQIALGMIRIFTKRTIDSLGEIFQKLKETEPEGTKFVDVEFSKYLNEELDKAFDF